MFCIINLYPVNSQLSPRETSKLKGQTADPYEGMKGWPVVFHGPVAPLVVIKDPTFSYHPPWVKIPPKDRHIVNILNKLPTFCVCESNS